MQDEHTAVVGARAVAVRMLANLKNSHERRGDHARALVVCDRLVDLTGAPELRRDRGMHALALGAMEAGVVRPEGLPQRSARGEGHGRR